MAKKTKATINKTAGRTTVPSGSHNASTNSQQNTSSKPQHITPAPQIKPPAQPQQSTVPSFQQVSAPVPQTWHQPVSHPSIQPSAPNQHYYGTAAVTEAPRPSIPPSYPRPPKSKRNAFVDNYDLPQRYGSTNVTLLPRDPYAMHVYWEVDSSSLKEARKHIGAQADNASYTLRVYDITFKDFNGFNANRSFDIDVGPQAVSNWYLDIWNDNASFCADIGIRAPNGEFVTLARSNFTNTPRAGSSGRSELIWMDLKSKNKLPFIYVEKKGRKGSSDKSIDAKRKRKIYLTEDDIRAYYSRLFPMLRKVLSRKRKFSSRRAELLAMGIDEDDLEDSILLEDVLLQGLSRSEFLKRILLGSSAEMVLKKGASENIFSGASVPEQKKKSKFFFEIGTELIVYGRTEPDATVWLGNKKVALRPDGTFTLRYALPDGNIPFDFTAVSFSKEHQRKITTAVERKKTIYNPPKDS